MRNRILVACLAAAALCIGAQPAHASRRAATYVTANAFVGVVQPVPNPARTLGYGGYVFPADGDLPTSVQVNDVNNGYFSVGVSVCQDANGNGTCGEPGEPYRQSCIRASERVDLTNNSFRVPFRADLDTAVFIYKFATACGEGPGGSVGVIVLS